MPRKHSLCASLPVKYSCYKTDEMYDNAASGGTILYCYFFSQNFWNKVLVASCLSHGSGIESMEIVLNHSTG